MCFICGKSPNSLTVIMSRSQVKEDMTHSGDGLLLVQLRIQANQISRRWLSGTRQPFHCSAKLWPGHWWCPRCRRMCLITICSCLTGTEKLHWGMHPHFQYALYLSIADAWMKMLVKNLNFCYHGDFRSECFFFQNKDAKHRSSRKPLGFTRLVKPPLHPI